MDRKIGLIIDKKYNFIQLFYLELDNFVQLFITHCICQIFFFISFNCNLSSFISNSLYFFPRFFFEHFLLTSFRLIINKFFQVVKTRSILIYFYQSFNDKYVVNKIINNISYIFLPFMKLSTNFNQSENRSFTFTTTLFTYRHSIILSTK